MSITILFPTVLLCNMLMAIILMFVGKWLYKRTHKLITFTVLTTMVYGYFTVTRYVLDTLCS